jgi:hypothetical protein
MTISIYEWSYALGVKAPELNSRIGRSRLAGQVSRLLSRTPSPRYERNPNNLQQFIDLYGEQVTVDAIGDINRYFQVTQARGYTSGGLPTQLPPLSIGPGDVRPSTTAISVIGEGLAGWHLEQRQLSPRARPIGESIDLVFEDASSKPGKYVLVQVKATQQQDIVGQMKKAVPELLQYAYNVAAVAPQNAYACNVIGVVIGRAGDFDILSLELDFM